MARKAAKYLSQACKNFLPAQGAKMEVRKSAKELINHKQQIFDFILQTMTMKVKAVEKKLKFTKNENDPGVWRYVMTPEQYSSLSQKKVIKEAALRSGVSQGVMQACWDAAGEVIKAWATEGHSVALPGLGTMRFGLRSKSVENVNDVKSSLITSRRIIFTPDVDLKDELKNTAVQITCYDRNGEEVKRVTSADDAEVEDPENTNNGESGSTTNGSNGTNGGGTGSITPSGGDSGGTNNGGGSNTGGNGDDDPDPEGDEH